MSDYRPPLTISAQVLRLVERIGETLGRWSARAEPALAPHLRRGNRIRTIQASLAIEANSLSLEQVTAVLDGKRVLGLPREIQEVRNAFAAYESLPGWSSTSMDDLLSAHGRLMQGLTDDAGRLRGGGVGIYRGEDLVHMSPPASRVSGLVGDLLDWLAQGELSPLVASCVLHYELEFIHPFSDGNGRLGRLWQTLILSRWRSVFTDLPVETVVRDRQDAYYRALAESDAQADAAPFVVFMLDALLVAIEEAILTDQVTDQVSDQVRRLLAVLRPGESLEAVELMERLGLRHRPTFRQHYLRPALDGGWIEMSQPESPSSPAQRYLLSSEGRRVQGA
jgi:Fic family protein